MMTLITWPNDAVITKLLLIPVFSKSVRSWWSRPNCKKFDDMFLKHGVCVCVCIGYPGWNMLSVHHCYSGSGLTRNSGHLNKYPSRALPALSLPSLPLPLPFPLTLPLSILSFPFPSLPTPTRPSLLIPSHSSPHYYSQPFPSLSPLPL